MQHFRDLASGLVRREAADQPDKAPTIAAGLAAARTSRDHCGRSGPTDAARDA